MGSARLFAALSFSLLSCRICSNWRRGIGPVWEPTDRVLGLCGCVVAINGGVPLAIGAVEQPAIAEHGLPTADWGVGKSR
jgi:hypothetical protein